MFELIISSTFIIVFIVLLVLYSKTKIKNRKLKSMIIQLEIDKKILSDKLASVDSSIDLSHQAGFLKFLTESREWAYKYIDEVQKAIIDFRSEVGPSIEHYRNYGAVMWTPLHDSFNKVADAYDELMKMLPKDENEIQT